MNEPQQIIGIIFGLLVFLIISWVVCSLIFDNDKPNKEEDITPHSIVVRCNHCYHYNFYRDIKYETEVICTDCGRMNDIQNQKD